MKPVFPGYSFLIPPLWMPACGRQGGGRRRFIALATERRGPAPRQVQDSALNLTWFSGGGVNVQESDKYFNICFLNLKPRNGSR